MGLTTGTRLGPYEIVSALGAGGMGEVYRARDSKLGRDVAIKILPPQCTEDPARRSRFAREARVLASLNHPHIGAIYGLEDNDGVTALVLELVEGATLAERLQKGALPIPEALVVASQIADALAAAHEKGIVHRDLKPGNVMITLGGIVKVLDFGLAKAAEHVGSDATQSATVTAHATRDGIVLGTAGYMSPEQAKGATVDRRADLWAFGAVLYEMLTGHRAFAGDSVAETIACVLTKDPDWTALPPNTPATLHRLLQRCLSKDASRRLDSAAAARLEVDDALAPPQELFPSIGKGAATPRRVAVALALLAAGILCGAVAAVVWLRSIPPHPRPPLLLSIVPPLEHPLVVSRAHADVALSPDGQYLAYHSGTPSGGGQLILRPMGRADAAAPVAGINDGRSPFFSPDGRWMGFFEVSTSALSKVAVTGGPILTVSRGLGDPQSASWGDDDTIVFATQGTNRGLFAVSASGGEPRALTTIDTTRDEVAHRSPSMLPRNRGVLFTIAVGGVETEELAVLDLRTGKTRVLIPDAQGGQYVDTGHVVFVASGTLFAVGFDLEHLELRGQPVPLAGGLQVHTAVGCPRYTVSRAGVIAFLPPQVPARSLVWVDRKGRETSAGAPTRGYTTLTLSPDGTRAALASIDEERDVWIWDFAAKTMRRLTFDPGTDWVPIWTPDGRWILFRSNRGGRYNLYRQASDGSGSVERLTTSDNEPYPNAVTLDGQHVLGAELLQKTSYDIFRYPAVPFRSASSDQPKMADAATARGTPLISSPAAEYAVRFAPNGRYIAYQSTRSGRFEIYVQPYPDLSQGSWQISTGGGWAPVWARNGAELFYLDRSNTLMVVPVQTSAGSFSYGTARSVFAARYAGDFYLYDVAPDGERFLMVKDTGADNRAAIHIALNVLENLRAAAPAAR